MKKITIVGSGFSAAICKINFEKYNTSIISCSNPLFLKNKFNRRKLIEINKFFSKKAFSYGNLKYKLNNSKIHDRLILGGNTNIWGGMVDSTNIPKKFLALLKKNKIFLKNLEVYKNGDSSNNKNIKQI